MIVLVNVYYTTVQNFGVGKIFLKVVSYAH